MFFVLISSTHFHPFFIPCIKTSYCFVENSTRLMNISPVCIHFVVVFKKLLWNDVATLLETRKILQVIVYMRRIHHGFSIVVQWSLLFYYNKSFAKSFYNSVQFSVCGNIAHASNWNMKYVVFSYFEILFCGHSLNKVFNIVEFF